MFGGKEKGKIAYKAKLTFKSSYLWLLFFFFDLSQSKTINDLLVHILQVFFLIPAECLDFFFLSLL